MNGDLPGLVRTRTPCVEDFLLRIRLIGYSLYALDLMAFRVEGGHATQCLQHSLSVYNNAQ
jgi:hypothetical protein